LLPPCQILRQKCTKFDFGSAPDPAGAAYSAPPGFKGPILLRGREGDGKGGDWKGGEGLALSIPTIVW